MTKSSENEKVQDTNLKKYKNNKKHAKKKKYSL